MHQTVSLSLFRFDSAAARLWAFAQMGLARRGFARTPDIGFHKLLGTGVGEGFTPWPNTSVYAALAVWPDRATARARVSEGAVYRRYRRRASEHLNLFLRPICARGRWDGQTPFAAPSATSDARARPADEAPPPRSGPVASLTRATIKAWKLREFWRHEPAISRRVGANQAVRFKIGMGELPWLTQATFSIWPDAASMAAFARGSGPHAEAIRAVRENGYFAEELYARFEILEAVGAWEGRDPLADLAIAGPEEKKLETLT